MTTQQAMKVWSAVLGELQLQVTRPSYETWLKDTVGIASEDGEFTVGTPNAFVAEMLEQRMYSLIAQAMERVTNGPQEVRFQVTPSTFPSSTEGRITRTAPDVDDGRASAPDDGQGPVLSMTHRTIALNPRYTFGTFIVGKYNELAHAAALAVSERPGAVYNPLTIYSDVGLGKTHLLHAIGNQAQEKGLSLIYATSEEFTNEYIKAIRDGKTEEFRNRYRGTDVLLLDDIQFLIGKEQTQEGFFHTFNFLHMINRQIVITSDRPLTSLTLLEGRVRSRLAGGLVVDVQPPDLETRLAILRAKAEQAGHHIPPDVLQFLAERFHRNVRELEGSLNRVVAHAQLTQSAVTVDLVKRAVADALAPNGRKPLSPRAVIDAVAAYFQVDTDALEGPRGKKNVSLARQVAMHLLREETDLGPTAIGRALGGRDHSTVVKNCATIARQSDVDPGLRRDLINIRDTLTPGPPAAYAHR